jgi:hypothetical protein
LIQDQQSFTWTARLYYRYSTLANGNAEALSESEFRKRQQQQSTTFNNDITKANSGGPIQMKIMANNPIVTRASGIPVRIEFQNVGGGRVFVPTSYTQAGYSALTTESYDKVFIGRLYSDIGEVKDCSSNGTIRSTVTLNCRIYVSQQQLNVPKSNVNIQAEIIYGYQVDKDFQVAVKKLFGDETGGGSTVPGSPPTSPGTGGTGGDSDQPPAI